MNKSIHDCRENGGPTLKSAIRWWLWGGKSVCDQTVDDKLVILWIGDSGSVDGGPGSGNNSDSDGRFRIFLVIHGAVVW